MNKNRMITTSIIITALGLIIAAVGVSFFRHFSSIKSQESFKEASEDRQIMKNKIDAEFDKTIVELKENRSVLTQRINDETDSIVDELKKKSKEVQNALDNLKAESNQASKDIYKEVKNIKDKSDIEFRKLNHPLPKEISTNYLTFLIDTKGLEKYVDAILKNGFKNDDHLDPNSKYKYFIVDADVGEFDISIKDLFNGSTIHLSMFLGNNARPDIDLMHTSLLNWGLNIDIDLDNEFKLLFVYDTKDENGHHFKLQTGTSIFYKSNTNRYKDITSAIEMCNQTVYSSIYITNSTFKLFDALNVRIEPIVFGDNYTNAYEISFNEVIYVESDYYKKLAPNQNIPTIKQFLYKGKLTCRNL